MKPKIEETNFHASIRQTINEGRHRLCRRHAGGQPRRNLYKQALYLQSLFGSNLI